MIIFALPRLDIGSHTDQHVYVVYVILREVLFIELNTVYVLFSFFVHTEWPMGCSTAVSGSSTTLSSVVAPLTPSTNQKLSQAILDIFQGFNDEKRRLAIPSGIYYLHNLSKMPRIWLASELIYSLIACSGDDNIYYKRDLYRLE